MSNVKYFEKQENFWEHFENLLSSREQNNPYIISVAANVISVSNIKFPYISSEEFTHHFIQRYGTTAKRLVFKNCIFEKDFNVSSKTVIDLLQFENCKFLKKVNISLSGLKKFEISNSLFDEGLNISKISTNYTKEFIFKNSTVKNLLNISECVLNGAQFYNVNLELATVKISDTVLLDIKMNNVIWGKRFECKRDIFRQLKVVMQKHSNYIDANKFHSLELNEYRKELSKYSIYEKFEDKILFNVNWAISSFSTSWLKPLSYLILFSLIIYCGLCLSNAINECGINSFFKFFNPLNKKVYDEYKNIYWIWFLHKIISGFFIYHFIIAMKRLTKN